MRILRSYDSVAPPSSHWCPYPEDSVSMVTLAIHLLFSLPFPRGGLHPVSPGLPSSSPNWCPCQSIPYITHCRVIHPEARIQFLSFLCSNSFSDFPSQSQIWNPHHDLSDPTRRSPTISLTSNPIILPITHSTPDSLTALPVLAQAKEAIHCLWTFFL